LILSGVNIEGEAGIGYVVRRGFDLPPLMFSKEEISALTLGARIVESWADPALAVAAQTALSKIESVLPDELKDGPEKTPLFAPMTQIRPDIASKMSEIRLATDAKRKVVLDYADANYQRSRRTIWPLGLFFWGVVWTMGAWCELRKNFRVFRLDRIQKMQVLDETYPVEKGKTLQDLIEHEKTQSYYYT
jgi:predicted DNA-binding transcriptional regulator YafY